MSADPRRSAADYAEGWSQLLPQGPAWPRERDTTLMQFIGGMAAVWGDTVDLRAHLLRDVEAHPDTTQEMLDAWERVLGLPEVRLDNEMFDEDGYPVGTRWFVPGGGLPIRAGASRAGARAWDDEASFDRLMDTMARRLGALEEPAAATLTDDQRRQRAVAKLTARGGQSRQYFLDMAAAYGFDTAAIREFSPFRCGVSRCGSQRWRTGAPEMRFTWRMYVGPAPVTYFRCGRNRCGRDPQAKIQRAYELEYWVRRWKPAHTKVEFLYTKSEEA